MTAILWAALGLVWGAVALTTGIAIGLTIHQRDQHETPTNNPAPGNRRSPDPSHPTARRTPGSGRAHDASTDVAQGPGAGRWTPPQDSDPLEQAWLLPAREPQP